MHWLTMPFCYTIPHTNVLSQTRRFPAVFDNACPNGERNVSYAEADYFFVGIGGCIGGYNITYMNATAENNFLPMPDKSLHADIIYLCSPNNYSVFCIVSNNGIPDKRITLFRTVAFKGIGGSLCLYALKGDCAEMEGASIAHGAYLNQIPFVIIRAISDKADDKEPERRAQH